ETIWDDRAAAPSIDPSRPGQSVAHFLAATPDDAERAIGTAVDDPDDWRGKPVRERSRVLHRVAAEIARERGSLLGAMMAEGGKLLPESDPEISEAIDFCRFYGQTSEWYHTLPGLEPRGKGVV